MFIALLLVACGDDSPSNTPPDMSSPDTGLADVGSDDTSIDVPDVPDIPVVMCDEVQDIGIVEDGLELKIDLGDPGPIELSGCVVPEVESGARVLQLRVATSSRLTLTADAIPNLVGDVVIPPEPAIEIRRADCAPANAGECTRLRSTVFNLDADVDYFMVINAKKDSGGVQLKFELDEVVCTSAENGCTDGVIAKCSEDGSILAESKCVDACDASDGCLGNTCDSATDVIVAASGTTTITGNRAAYLNSWSAENRAGCNLQVDEQPGPTVGPDFVIRVPDMAKDSTLTLSAENPLNEGVYAFFIVDSCAAVGCLAAGSFDETTDNQLKYVVPNNGDVLVRVEALGNMDRFFAIDVSVTQ